MATDDQIRKYCTKLYAFLVSEPVQKVLQEAKNLQVEIIGMVDGILQDLDDARNSASLRSVLNFHLTNTNMTIKDQAIFRQKLVLVDSLVRRLNGLKDRAEKLRFADLAALTLSYNNCYTYVQRMLDPRNPLPGLTLESMTNGYSQINLTRLQNDLIMVLSSFLEHAPLMKALFQELSSILQQFNELSNEISTLVMNITKPSVIELNYLKQIFEDLQPKLRSIQTRLRPMTNTTDQNQFNTITDQHNEFIYIDHSIRVMQPVLVTTTNPEISQLARNLETFVNLPQYSGRDGCANITPQNDNAILNTFKQNLQALIPNFDTIANRARHIYNNYFRS